MAKIVNIITESSKKYSLLKDVIAENQQINEVGATLGKVAGTIKNTVSAAKNSISNQVSNAKDAYNTTVGNPTEPDKNQTTEQPNEPAQSKPADVQDTILHNIASDVLKPASGISRVVLRMSKANLNKYYLQNSGGAAFIENIPDDALLAFATSPYLPHTEKSVLQKSNNLHQQAAVDTDANTPKPQDQVTSSVIVSKQKPLNEEPDDVKPDDIVSGELEIQVMKPSYKFSDLIKSTVGNADYTVLINAPSKIVSDLNAAAGKKDINAIKTDLTNLMDHKYYVLTLNNSVSNKIASKLDNAGADLEEQVKVFNPAAIAAMPHAQDLKQAHDAFGSIHSTQTNSVDNENSEDQTDDSTDNVSSTASPEDQTREGPLRANSQKLAKTLDAAWTSLTAKGINPGGMDDSLKTLISKMYNQIYKQSASSKGKK